MRALLRVSIQNCTAKFSDSKTIESIHALKDHSDEYKNFIENLFIEIGFSPIPIAVDWHKMDYNDVEKNFKAIQKSTADGEFTSEILEVFDQVPKDIRSRELCKLYFLGSISKGQASFLVTAVNAKELHIRIHAGLFRRVKDACEQFKNKLEEHEKKSKNKTHLKIDPKILVMEHKREIATIEGNILNQPFIDACKINKVNSRLFFFGVLFSILVASVSALKFYGIVPYHFEGHSFLTKFIHVLSVDKLFPPILIFLTTSGIPIFISWMKFRKRFPIVWDNI